MGTTKRNIFPGGNKPEPPKRTKNGHWPCAVVLNQSSDTQKWTSQKKTNSPSPLIVLVFSSVNLLTNSQTSENTSDLGERVTGGGVGPNENVSRKP